jgi:hypothetical protein
MSYTKAELLEKNLLQVWNERNSEKRLSMIETIYADNSTLFEADESICGYDAINKKIGSILNGIPPDFVFHVINPASINHNAGRLSWRLGPANGPTVGTGMDIALFKGERIQSLYVFLDTNKSG